MARVRTVEEVEEIKLREKIKLSLVRQQIDLNREIGQGGCPTARGKVYITSIFQKNGQLSVTRPHLSLECQIRAHLNQKDLRNRKPAMYDPRLDEPQIRQYCATRYYKEKCHVLRRFVEETDSIIVKRELPHELRMAEAEEGEAGETPGTSETAPPTPASGPSSASPTPAASASGPSTQTPKNP